jgi:HAMP domain-containing protein
MKTRLLAAAAVLVSAAIHLQMWFDGVRDQDVIGELFMVNAVAGAVIAVLLVVWRSWPPLLLAVGFGASTFGAFIISATWGLFDVNAHWEGWRVWAAAASEVVAVLAGLAAGWREGYLSRLQSEKRLAGHRPDLH